jgi:hypothetical protein
VPRFRASYVERSGAQRVVFVEGASAASVALQLERSGARGVSVIEDFLSLEGRDLAAEQAHWQERAAGAPSVPAHLSPIATTDVATFIDERLALPAPKPPPTPARAALSWLGAAVVVGVIGGLGQRGPNGGRMSALNVVIMLGVLGWGTLAVTPLWLDARTRHARAWRDWPAVLRLTALAAWHPLIRSRPALRYGFGTLRAAALAGTGRLEEALALVERVGRDNRLSESLIDSARANVYLAVNRHDEGIELRRRVAQDPTRVGARVDLAVALLQYRRDTVGAHEQLTAVTAPPTSLLEAAFRSLARGLLDIEEGRPAEAVVALGRARRAFEREAAGPQLEGVLLWLDPFLCSALALAGEREKALAMLPRVTRYLEATSQPEWLLRCREALTSSTAPAAA